MDRPLDDFSSMVLRTMVDVERTHLLEAIRKAVGSVPSDWSGIDTSMSALLNILLEMHRNQLKALMMAMDFLSTGKEIQFSSAVASELDKLPILGVQTAAISTILTAHLRIAEEGQRMNTAHLHVDKLARIAKEVDEELVVGVVDKDGLHVRQGGSNG